ncbi:MULTISPECIES: hypothetical protein [Latilactobacillus]|uniref:Uncharacterized protein n=1 Tax=Latilactobacillus curvatus TaxID=28038 RepID=A0ABM7QWH2_LATCU|nr:MULTISPECIES: hypothetical protein [Latilactobacillus]ASN13592.1 hypothetical protein B4V05_10190 [Latilactobacillus sakei]KGB14491.1 hypothetical protein KY41_06920 [Latilactobacillus sakei]MCW8780632.1 hypothetical protein [Latilactobacillus curvatus]UTB73286.1 hypothetical protein A4W72_11045 [Latilactobacillus curvatus]BCX31539.1 hypothetical protein LTWDN19_21060 [Latilactobacillus curvatus]
MTTKDSIFQKLLESKGKTKKVFQREVITKTVNALLDPSNAENKELIVYLEDYYRDKELLKEMQKSIKNTGGH